MEPTLDASNNSLEWWERKEHKYPLTVQVAFFAFAVPSSSTLSERVFSQAG